MKSWMMAVGIPLSEYTLSQKYKYWCQKKNSEIFFKSDILVREGSHVEIKIINFNNKLNNRQMFYSLYDVVSPINICPSVQSV